MVHKFFNGLEGLAGVDCWSRNEGVQGRYTSRFRRGGRCTGCGLEERRECVKDEMGGDEESDGRRYERRDEVQGEIEMMFHGLVWFGVVPLLHPLQQYSA